jgi:HSP20 family protein
MTNKKTKDESHKPDESDSTALAIPSFGFPGIFEDFARPFGDWMKPFFPSSMRSFWTEFGGKEPAVDLQDRGDHLVLTAELPGFDRKDVEVRVEGNGLELKAEKRSEKESKTPSGMGRQSSYAYFHRYFTLPERVVSEKVDGTMKNGVLELKLPKKEPTKDRSWRVDLK